MLKRSEKEAIINDLKDHISKAKGIFVTNLVGISANDAVAVRKAIREANGATVVTRNTLIERAATGTPAAEILKGLKGPSAVAFAFDDPAAVAKCIKEAGKKMELVNLRGGLLGDKVLSTQEVMALADLPSRDQMLGTLLATFMAPVSAFARVMNEIKVKAESEQPAQAE